MPKPDHRSQMARAWLHFHAALGRTWKQGSAGPACRLAKPIHAVSSISPSLREGIDDGPRLRADPLGLSNWQMTQRTAFEMRKKTGSDVFIAASTMAGEARNREFQRPSRRARRMTPATPACPARSSTEHLSALVESPPLEARSGSRKPASLYPQAIGPEACLEAGMTARAPLCRRPATPRRFALLWSRTTATASAGVILPRRSKKAALAEHVQRLATRRGPQIRERPQIWLPVSTPGQGRPWR
jgi:hypothetical protein